MPLPLRTQNDSFAFVHELKQEMHADLKYVESLEDELDELESDKAENFQKKNCMICFLQNVCLRCYVSYLQSSSDLDDDHLITMLYFLKSWYVTVLHNASSEQTEFIVQLILFIVDSWIAQSNEGNYSCCAILLKKFLGTVRFGNDQFAPILGYGDLVQGNITIKRVYYVEGKDLLTASPTQAWLWHRRLSHLNFDYINLLSKKDVVIGLPKLKDGENLDNVGKKKEDSCILVDTPLNQRDIVLQQENMASDSLVPQRQKASDLWTNLDRTRTTKYFSSAVTTVPSQQELDFFSRLLSFC
ncbi:retrovirus-related pol polyprotein from transposon TNT 1-94 [Tanacetum coccineum]